MSNPKKNLHNVLPGQEGIFGDLEGSADISSLFRDQLSKSFSRCRLSRWQIAAKISEMTRHNIGKDTLDKITSQNRNYALRAEDLPAVIVITGDVELARILLAPTGLKVLEPAEGKLLRLLQLTEKRKKIVSEILHIEKELGLKDV